MGDVLREALANIFANYGLSIATDRQRFKALLRDLAGDHRREVNLLILAQEHNVPADLLANRSVSGAEISRLAIRLRDDVGIQEDLARWAVETWAIALGLTCKAAPEDTSAQIAVSTEAESWLTRGIAYAEAGLKERAIAALSKGIQLQPDSAEAYYQRGQVYYKDEPQRAIEDFTEAIILNPKHYSAYTERGRCFARLGDTTRAWADLERAMELATDDEEPYDWLYYTMGLGRFTDDQTFGTDWKVTYSFMVNAYSRAIQAKPDFYAGYLYRGRAYDALEEYERAIADYTSAIVLRPDDWRMYYYRAQAHNEKGDREQAQADFQKTIELGTHMYFVGQAQEELRKLKKASRDATP